MAPIKGLLESILSKGQWNPVEGQLEAALIELAKSTTVKLTEGRPKLVPTKGGPTSTYVQG